MNYQSQSPLQRLARKKQKTLLSLNSAKNAIDEAGYLWGIHAAQTDDINQRIQDLERLVEKQWQTIRSDLIQRK